jgi:hypothetical protein
MMTVAGARYRQQFGGHFPAHCQRSPATPITPVIHRFAFLLQSYRLFWCQCGMSSKVRDREAANPGWPDVDYAPLMDEAFHARGADLWSFSLWIPSAYTLPDVSN